MLNVYALSLLGTVNDRLREERAQTFVEYSLILALVGIGVVVLLGTLGGRVQDAINSVISMFPG